MTQVRLQGPTDFDGWRAAARALRLAEIPPDRVRWSADGPEGARSGGLFDADAPPTPAAGAAFTAPRAFLALAQVVICHRAEDRFDRLYRLLWRLRDEPRLLDLLTDPDVAQAFAMQKTVRQAEHKMHAFVRFRRVDDAADETTPEEYFAWYEPPHYVIELGAGFFVRRLANVRFTIASPYVTVTWDRAQLLATPGGAPDGLPAEDAAEEAWKTYFANVFNPARLNPTVMRQHMPEHYWKNLPEAQLIPSLVRGAQERTQAMVDAGPTAPSALAARRGAQAGAPELPPPAEGDPTTLAQVAAGLQACRRCGLWRDATQAVPGDGPAAAALMFVGEQPGDMEDLKGKPFVGPAGQLFDRALAEAGVPRADAYVTNSVKHFKHELRGKRRIHAKPDAGEVAACNLWLQAERRIVRPRVVVALGATASSAVFRKGYSVMRDRGVIGPLDDGAVGVLTVHPSFLLRLPDEDAKAREFALFVRDLKAAYALVSG
jgi:DNA polymerase